MNTELSFLSSHFFPDVRKKDPNKSKMTALCNQRCFTIALTYVKFLTDRITLQ